MFANPFEITKAVDFTDAEIQQTFVDFPSGGVHAIADPSSAMPQFLVGGKGGGRTHLMRYYSYPLQRQRSLDLMAQLQVDGYLGIYFRCSGLNGSRFTGKGVTDEAWMSVFSYYMDVWLTEHLLNVLIDVNHKANWGASAQAEFAMPISSLLRDSKHFASSGAEPESLTGLREGIVRLRSSMDRDINNAALRRGLPIEVQSNPGRLLFAANAAAAKSLPGLQEVKLTYLIDEFENLSESQQIYINTLLREKELPTCFLIGSRIWGVRTHQTLSAGELNRDNSEFRWVVLENAYRQGKSSYINFCEQLAVSRLRRFAGGPVEATLSNVFKPEPDDKFEASRLAALVGDGSSADRPHMRRLERSLKEAVANPRTTEDIIKGLSIPSSPLLEKMALLRFYQAWSDGGDLRAETAVASRIFAESMLDKSPPEESQNFFKLWKRDLRDQLYVEHGRGAQYEGFAQFIEMSGFLPRSFLTILKYVAYWAEFNGERPFVSMDPISSESQIAGILDASRWFSVDALPSGPDGRDCDRAIRRLGSLLRRIRLSDKPTEVGSVAFSTDFRGVSIAAAGLLDLCVKHTLVVEIPNGRTARNSGSRLRKFQLHPMLAPSFDLPTARRGEISLRSDEVNAIFDPAADEDVYSRVAKRRLSTLNAPFSARDEAQEHLF